MSVARARLGDKRGELALDGVLTPHDLDEAFGRLASRLNERDEIEVQGIAFATDASGNATHKTLAVPAGKEGQIYVVCLEAAGYTVGSPFSGAGAYVSLHRDDPAAPGTMIDFTTSSTGVLPVIFTYGGDARLLRSSQSLWIKVALGPASTQITGSYQAVLRPVVTP